MGANNHKMKKEKNLIRCAVSNKVVNGKEVVLVDYALDYVKMNGYVVVEKRRIMNKSIAVVLLMMMVALMSILPSISAEQNPTQQYNRISLNPSYVPSITKNLNYSFDLNINPSDRITKIQSAIIVFQTYATSSPQDIRLFVNLKSCNNPIFTATLSGFTQASFDCSNIITKEGDYNLLLSSTKDVGSALGWIDLTYTNNPQGDIKISGTEYSPDDKATVFLQLKDNQGLEINNGTCYLDIYNPLDVNSSHSPYLNDAPMLYLNNSDGVYYYDLDAPSTLGVYMLSATCSYSFLGSWIYDLEGAETNKPTRTVTSGTYNGDAIFLNDFEDWIYTSCSSSTGNPKVCEAYYDFDTTIHISDLSNITNIDLFYMGESSVKSTINFSVWNWTSSSWIILPNTLTYSGLATSVPVGIGEFASNSLPLTDIISPSGIIRIRTYAQFGSTFFEYDNWLNIQIKKTTGIITDIKGSSEMHVSAPVNTTSIAEGVWNYAGEISPNILMQFANSTWNYAGTISSSIGDFFSEKVWSYIPRNLTFYPASATPEEIWNYSARNLTFTEDVTDYDAINSGVWNFGTRELTFYPIANISLSNVSATEITDKIRCYLEQINKQDNGEWNIEIISC